MRRRAFGVMLVCLAAWPLPAAADGCGDAPRARAAILGGATINSGDGAASVTGSFGYRIDRCFGLEVELGVIPDLQDEPEFFPLANVAFGATGSPIGGGITSHPRVPTSLIFPPPTFNTRLLTFMTNARVEIPTNLRAVIPYVVGGGGLASVRSESTFPPFIPLPEQGGVGNTIPTRLPLYTNASTETALALNIGAGVSVRIVKQLFADADMRYVRVFANQELDLNRFGGGISYRF